MNFLSFWIARLSVVAVVVSAACLSNAQEGPFIVSTVPANGATGVSPSAAVVFTFSEQMDTPLTEAQFFDFTMPFVPLPTTSAWSSGNRVLTCTPTPPFPSSTTIFWSVDGENIPGDPLEGDTFGTFSTSGGGGGTGSGTNRTTAFVVGKIHFYNQTSAGAPTLDPDAPYNFTGLTTLASNRTANGVSLTLPTGSVSNLTRNFLQPESFYLFFTSTNLPAFNTTFPSGNYLFNVMATTSNQQVTVNLPSGFVQPNAPHTTSFAAAQAVNASQPFQLAWDAFQGGTAADYISVSVGEAFRSPDVGTPGSLNGTATSIVIPAGTLQPNSNYSATIGFYRATSTSNVSYTTTAYLVTSTEFTLITSSGAATGPLILTNSAWSGAAFSFAVVSSPGQTFTVEYSSTMLTNQWQTLLTTNSASGRVQITHSATNKYLFYRARKNP